jgi:hypothetical protein
MAKGRSVAVGLLGVTFAAVGLVFWIGATGAKRAAEDRAAAFDGATLTASSTIASRANAEPISTKPVAPDAAGYSPITLMMTRLRRWPSNSA